MLVPLPYPAQLIDVGLQDQFRSCTQGFHVHAYGIFEIVDRFAGLKIFPAGCISPLQIEEFDFFTDDVSLSNHPHRIADLKRPDEHVIRVFTAQVFDGFLETGLVILFISGTRAR